MKWRHCSLLLLGENEARKPVKIFLAGAGRDQADVAIFCGHPNSISLLVRHLKTKYEYETSISTVSMHVCDIGGRCEGLLWAFDML